MPDSRLRRDVLPIPDLPSTPPRSPTTPRTPPPPSRRSTPSGRPPAPRTCSSSSSTTSATRRQAPPAGRSRLRPPSASRAKACGPSGTADPYGLRRHALAIIRILRAQQLHLDLPQTVRHQMKDEMSVDELKQWRDEGHPHMLIDVREPFEHASARIEGAVLIPMGEVMAQLAALPTDRTIVVQCQSGARSARVTAALRAKGYDATNLAGGILAWKRAGY